MASKTRLVPVILCGGPGARLWPLSRGLAPKPFVELPLPQGGTLIGALLESLNELDCHQIVYVAGRDLVAVCQAAHFAAGLRCPATVLAEPCARNTAAAIAVAAKHVAASCGADTIVAVLPSDHWIAKRDVFNAALQVACEPAADHLVTLGINPTAPATGYGYIKAGQEKGSWQEVEAFIEKPVRAKAKQMLEQGGHYWNAGVFVGAAGVFEAELSEHAPQVAKAIGELDELLTSENEKEGVLPLPESRYAAVPAISFDHAVMEKSRRAMVVSVTDAGWSDVGTWDDFMRLLPQGKDGNRTVGEVALADSEDVSVLGGDRLVAVAGCEGVNVVDTPDALLVTGRDSADSMRVLQEMLAGDPRLREPPAERRAWGRYTQLGTGPGWKVKRIEVDPGCRLSLQSHEHRAENWVVIAGKLVVTVGDKERQLAAGESCFIPKGARHRLANATDAPAALIEVQSGSYLGEDDITRYDDDFGRR